MALNNLVQSYDDKTKQTFSRGLGFSFRSFALSKQREMSYEILGLCLETWSSWLIKFEMLTKCAVNNHTNAVASFYVNREGEKCNLTGLVRWKEGPGKRQQRDSCLDLVVCFRRGGGKAVWQSSGGQTKCSNFLVTNEERAWTANVVVDVLCLSNPAVLFDPGSREITLSLMY